jgi:tRNA (guanine37-N1)-methyltransferase
MKIDILTLFPDMFDIFKHSIMGRAISNGVINIATHNIRDFSIDKHKKVDDYPYGGGAGMVMTAQPLVDSIKHVKSQNGGKVIFLGPRGKKFDHSLSKALSEEKELIFICGHYEGIDERVYEYIDEEISLGDFILTGGEMACIPIIDSLCRLIPGVLGKNESFLEESFYDGLLEYPHYTRPEIYDGREVPKILLSGHHKNIQKWREEQSLKITGDRRPDLMKLYKSTSKK